MLFTFIKVLVKKMDHSFHKNIKLLFFNIDDNKKYILSSKSAY